MAQGNYGTSTNPLSELFAEQIVLAPRTSNPSSPSQGDWWFRSDLAGGTKLGTLRFQHASGTWDIPILPTGGSASGVEEVFRVQTPNGIGYVPLTQTAPAFPKLKFQHGGNTFQWHDDVRSGSVVVQYYANNWSQGDATWPDQAGTAQDMTVNGDPQDGTLSDGSQSAVFDGANDHGLFTAPSSLEGSSLTEFSIEFALEFSNTDNTRLTGLRNNTGNQTIEVRINADEAFNNDPGNVLFSLRDDNSSFLTFAPTTSPGINDGNRHNVSFIINDTTTNDAEVIIDGTSQSLSFANQDGPSTFTGWDVDIAIAAWNDNGTVGGFSAVEIGANRWHDTGIADQTIQQYP